VANDAEKKRGERGGTDFEKDKARGAAAVRDCRLKALRRKK
jgi:hypothetical protein